MFIARDRTERRHLAEHGHLACGAHGRPACGSGSDDFSAGKMPAGPTSERPMLRSRGAFTLLEITLAVAILAMMSLTIYRFVQTNLTTLRISSEENAIEASYAGLISLLSAQWQSLPSGAGALTGEPLKVSDRSRDEITWTCGAGPGLLTRYASGDFRVAMQLRSVGGKGDRMEIGFTRKTKPTIDTPDPQESWISLLDNVGSLQIKYFDPRLNTWVDRWTDTVMLPRLVKLVIGRPDRSVPWETIIALGRTPL